MKQFIVDRHTTPNTPTLEQVPTEKIPIYEDMAAAAADLANLAENQIIAIHDTGSEPSAPVDTVQSGNMHAVTSNAVAESLSYSTEEMATGGKWIDGKPIYRKVFVHEETGLGNPSFDYGTISSFGQLIEAKTITVSNSGGNQEVEFMAYRRSRASISNGVATFKNEAQMTYNVDKYILIVEYTKTE